MALRVLERIQGILAGGGSFVENMKAMAAGGDDESSRDRTEKCWQSDREARKGREKQWQTNISYYLGNQWVSWNSSARSLQDLRAPSWRKLPVNNLIFVKVRSKMTRMATPPGFQVIPESNESNELRKAKHKERALSHAVRILRLKESNFDAAQWGAVCGDVYWDIDWDAEGGEQYNEQGEMYAEGEVIVKVRSPYEVWPGAACSVSNWGLRVWTADLLHADIVKAKYNLKEVAADAAGSTDIAMRAKLAAFFSGTGQSDFTAEKQSLEDMVMVRRLITLRSPASPNGSVEWIVGNKVVERKGTLDWFPLVHYRNLPLFGSFYGDTELRLSLERQRAHNRELQSIEEYHGVMKGKWLEHESARIKSVQIDSEHGERVRYSGSGPAPQAVPPPPLPADIFQSLDRSAVAIDDVFSDHNASQGKAAASQSGAAINYLVEEDSRQHTPSRDQWESAQERMAEKILDVMGRHYETGRKLTIVGEDLRADVVAADQDLLSGENRVAVVSGSSMPMNKTLRSEITRRNFEGGLYGDPKDPKTARKVLRQLDAGIVDDVYDDDALDEIRAERENERMAKGEIVIPEVAEGHDTHARVAARFIKSEQFFELQEMVKEIFRQHYALHMDLATGNAAAILAVNGMQSAIAAAPSAPGAVLAAPNAAPSGPVPGQSPAVEGPENLSRMVGQAAEPPPPPPGS